MRLCDRYNLTFGLEDHEKNPEFYLNKETGKFEGEIFKILKSGLFFRKQDE